MCRVEERFEEEKRNKRERLDLSSEERGKSLCGVKFNQEKENTVKRVSTGIGGVDGQRQRQRLELQRSSSGSSSVTTAFFIFQGQKTPGSSYSHSTTAVFSGDRAHSGTIATSNSDQREGSNFERCLPFRSVLSALLTGNDYNNHRQNNKHLSATANNTLSNTQQQHTNYHHHYKTTTITTIICIAILISTMISPTRAAFLHHRYTNTAHSTALAAFTTTRTQYLTSAPQYSHASFFITSPFTTNRHTLPIALSFAAKFTPIQLLSHSSKFERTAPRFLSASSPMSESHQPHRDSSNKQQQPTQQTPRRQRRLAEFDSFFFETTSSPQEQHSKSSDLEANSLYDEVSHDQDYYYNDENDVMIYNEHDANSQNAIVGGGTKPGDVDAHKRPKATSSSSQGNRSDNQLQKRDEARQIPPSYDFSYYDDGFGGHAYQPHLHEDLESNTQSQLLPVGTPSAGDATKQSPFNMTATTSSPNNDQTIQSTSIFSSEKSSQPWDRANPDSRYSDIMAKDTFEQTPPPTSHTNKQSDGITSYQRIELLTTQLEQLQSDIYASNNDKAFNINSPKQVSEVLFNGDGTQSTNKDILEALASSYGNPNRQMANLILQWRKCHRDLKREQHRIDNIEKNNNKMKTTWGGVSHDEGYSLLDPHDSSINENTMSSVLHNETGSTEEQQQQQQQPPQQLPRDPLLLVDASAYIFRAYYSMPPLHRSDGMPVGAVLGFCNMINRLILDRLLAGERPRLVLIFDAKGKTFRHFLYEDYKANRKPCPVDLVPQFDLVREAAEAYGMPLLEAVAYEADDVIATMTSLAQKEGVNVNILSGDKDLMQLVTESDASPNVVMIDPMTMNRISYDSVIEKWGVPPEKLGDVLALAGDTSDNVPGVPGIGPKIASSLINDFGSLDALLDRVEEVKQKKRREKLKENTEMAKLSRELVALENSIPIEEITMPIHFNNISEVRMDALDGERLIAFYDRMGFKDLKNRVQGKLLQNARRGSSGCAQRAYPDSDGDDSRNMPTDSTTPAPHDLTFSTVRDEIQDNAENRKSQGPRKNQYNGLLKSKRKFVKPPRPEDYDSVPF